MPSPPKIVVLGAAHPHVLEMAKAAKQVGDVTGVWDADASLCAQAASCLEIPPLPTVADALAVGPQLVLSGAIPGQRAELAMAAAEAGAAALIDKPLAVTHEALDAAMMSVQRFGRPIITYYPYRGEPFIRAAKQALDDGRIGKLVRVMSCGPHRLDAAARPAWHWTRADNGGCIIDVGSHHIDICCWFANQVPSWLCGTQVNVSQPERLEFQDFAQLQMRFAGGELAHVEADWLTPQSMKHFGDTRMWIQGTTGKIEVRLGDERSAYLWTSKDAEQALEVSAYPSVEQWTCQLIADLCADRPCSIDQEDVWRASRVSLYAFDSAQAGGRPIDQMRLESAAASAKSS